MKGKRLSKAKPVIRTSIFAFKAERKTIAHDRDLKDARVLLDRQDPPDNLDPRVRLGRQDRQADRS
jgi:hypothetical protein